MEQLFRLRAYDLYIKTITSNKVLLIPLYTFGLHNHLTYTWLITKSFSIAVTIYLQQSEVNVDRT